jgi:adenylate cyclase
VTDATSPEEKNRRARSGAADASAARQVFISYASQDAVVAGKLCDAIETSGAPCWIAPRDVRPGEAYAAAIVNAINDSRMLVLLVSKHAIDSPHVLREVERASSKRRPILAIRLDASELPPELEYFLSANQWLDASGGSVERVLAGLVEAVRDENSGNDQRDAADAGGTAPRSLSSPPPSMPSWLAARRGRAVLLVASALAIGGIGYFVLDRVRVSKPAAPQLLAPAVAAAVAEKSVAVLPFVNMSEDKNNEYFSDGLSEELIGLLTRVPDLKVPARTSSFYFKGKQTTIAEIGKTLGVAHVLEGSVRKSGNTLRITAQLIRVNDGYDMWSETYDRKLDDIFKVQDEISGAVVSALKVALLGDGVPKAKPVANQEAYALFLQSRSLHYRGTHADVVKAIDYAQRAVQLDPGFAPAWAAIADSLVYEYGSYGGPHDEVRARAYSAAKTAIGLDPNLSDGHLAMGRVLGELDWNWAAADVELQAALELEPNNVLALGIASNYALCRGRLAEGLRLAQKAATLDAVSVDAYNGVGDAHFAAGRFADAEAAYRKGTELNATRAGLHAALGIALLARGEPAAAVTVMQQETDEAFRHYGLALALDAVGRHSDADSELAALETGYPDSSAENIGSVYACRSELDKAFAWLDRAYRQRDGGLATIRFDPCVKNLLPDPRFKVLLSQLNLAP